MNTEEIKDEIIANLIDRFEDLFSNGTEEDAANFETIERHGDTAQTEIGAVSEEYSIKPSAVLIAFNGH